MIHCLHGALGHFSNWDLLKESLGQEISAPDLWELFENHSPTLAQAGQLIADQAAQGDILLGYSMGGRLALHALLAEPHKWRAAIIVSAHPGLSTGHHDRLAQDEKWAHLARSDWPGFLQEWNAQSILPEVQRGLEPAPASAQAAVAQSFCNWSLGKQDDLRPLLKKIPCPLLWLSGQEDQKFTQLAEACVPLLKDATHRSIPHCGHRIPWEAPQRFAHSIEDFLTKKPIP